jgi:hypothetical protein
MIASADEVDEVETSHSVGETEGMGMPPKSEPQFLESRVGVAAKECGKKFNEGKKKSRLPMPSSNTIFFGGDICYA